jgi:hypothetical protein
VTRIPHATDLNFGAALLAWLWPGLGHIWALREPKRGGLIMFGMLFLIVSGVLVGGIDSVDRKEDRLWFLAQALNGPIAFAIDAANQQYVKKLPDDERLLATSIGRPNEMGQLFVALAGLMNLVVMLDALVREPAPARPSGGPERRMKT